MSRCIHHGFELKAVGLQSIYVATELRMSPFIHHEFELKAVGLRGVYVATEPFILWLSLK